MAATDIRQSTNLVLLLGAGFSTGYGPPVMKDFMATARRKYWKLKEDKGNGDFAERYEEMFRFQQDCRNASWAFNRDWDNIEELYTQADLLRLAESPTREESESRCRKIAWAIWDVYREYSNGQHPRMEAVLNRILSDGYEPAIITTNYDVLCEVGLREQETTEWDYYYPGFGLPWNARKDKQRSVKYEGGTLRR